MPKRSGDSLFPLEFKILSEALRFAGTAADFHGWDLSRALESSQSMPIAHGSVYRALIRLESLGFLASRWEDPTISEMQSRPRRRLYRVTAIGASALAKQPALIDGSSALISLLRPVT